MLFYLSEISYDLKTEIDTAESAPHKETTINERRVSILEYLIHITYLVTNMQFKSEILSLFSLNLIEFKIIEILISFYKNQKVLRLKSFLKEFHDLMLEITGIIRNLTENFQLEKKNLKSLKMEQVLKEFKPKHRYFQYMIDEIILNINRKTLVESLVYLKTFKDASRIIDNKYAYNDLLFISKIVNKPLFNQHKLFIDFGTEKLFSSILSKLYDVRGELDFKKDKIEYYYPNNKAGLNERRISIFYYVLFIINWLTFNSVQLNLYLNKLSMIKVLVLFLRDDKFLNKLIRSNLNILSSIIKNLTKFSRYSVESKKYWTDSFLFEILLKLRKLLHPRETDASAKTLENAKLEIEKCICYCVSFLINDSQIERLKESEYFLHELLHDLSQFSNFIEHNGFLDKNKREHLNDSRSAVLQVSNHEVSSINGHSLTGIIDSLRRYSVNFKAKKEIFKEINSIKIIVSRGTFIEKVYALKLVAQLCFDNEICLDLIKRHNDLIENVQDTLQDASNDDQNEVISLCENILWSLNQAHVFDDEIPCESKHIMLSFSWNLKAQCMKIQNDLKKSGYTVSINTNPYYLLDETKKAIEEASCVLVCICEKYRLDENCQLEALYANKLNKHCIPLVMQEGYENLDMSCWISVIASGKKMVNFVNIGFGESMKILKKELEKLNIEKGKSCVNTKNEAVNQSQAYSTSILVDYEVDESEIEDDDENEEIDYHDFLKSDSNITNTDSPKEKRETKQVNSFRKVNAEKWDEKQVATWLLQENVHEAIYNAFKKLNGQTLKELYNIKRENPQYFHQSLVEETNRQVKLSELAYFISKLTKLFDDS
jgi:hypothetical protein